MKQMLSVRSEKSCCCEHCVIIQILFNCTVFTGIFFADNIYCICILFGTVLFTLLFSLKIEVMSVNCLPHWIFTQHLNRINKATILSIYCVDGNGNYIETTISAKYFNFFYIFHLYLLPRLVQLTFGMADWLIDDVAKNWKSVIPFHRATNHMDIYLSFEFMESDLHNVIKRGSILKDIHKRYIMYQVFNATNFIHSGNIIHRDLKPSNILVDSKCR